MKAAKDYTGYWCGGMFRFPGDCNDKQLEVLHQFRIAVTNMGLSDPPFDDATLLRFLRARKFDLAKTQQMFTAHIAWYKENDVANIQVLSFSILRSRTCSPSYPKYAATTLTATTKLINWYTSRNDFRVVPFTLSESENYN
jgi:hypothetical protein